MRRALPWLESRSRAHRPRLWAVLPLARLLSSPLTLADGERAPGRSSLAHGLARPGGASTALS